MFRSYSTYVIGEVQQAIQRDGCELTKRAVCCATLDWFSSRRASLLDLLLHLSLHLICIMFLCLDVCVCICVCVFVCVVCVTDCLQDRHHLLDVCKEYKKRPTGKGGKGKGKRSQGRGKRKRHKPNVHGAVADPNVQSDEELDDADEADGENMDDVSAQNLGMNFDFDAWMDDDNEEQNAWVSALGKALGVPMDDDDEDDGEEEVPDNNVEDAGEEEVPSSIPPESESCDSPQFDDAVIAKWEERLHSAIEALQHRKDAFDRIAALPFQHDGRGFIKWSHRIVPLPKLLPLCMLQSGTGIITVAHWSVPTTGPKVDITWCEITSVVGSGEARWVRQDNAERLISTAELSDKKFNASGSKVVHPDIGCAMIRSGPSGRQSVHPAVKHLRTMCRAAFYYPVVLLDESCFLCKRAGSDMELRSCVMCLSTTHATCAQLARDSVKGRIRASSSLLFGAFTGRTLCPLCCDTFGI